MFHVDSLVAILDGQMSSGLSGSGVLSVTPLFCGKFGLNCNQAPGARKLDIVCEVSGSYGGEY